MLMLAMFTMASIGACSSEQTHLRNGNKYFDSGNYDKAIIRYTWAVEANSENPSSYYFRSLAYKEKGEMDKALKDVSESITKSGGFAQAYIVRGMIFSDRSQYGDALSDFNSALTLNKDDQEVRKLKAEALFFLKKLDESLTIYSSLLKSNPEDYELHRNIADIFYEKQEYENAISSYQQALNLNPDDHYTINNLAWVFATTPDNAIRNGEKSLALAKEAVARNDTPMNWDTYAAALAELGKYSEAIVILDRIRKLEGVPESVELRLKLYQKKQPFRESRGRRTIEQ